MNNQQVPQGNQQFPTPNYPAQNFQPPVQQNKKKPPVWLIVIIVIVAIAVIGGLTGAFDDEEDSKNKDNNSDTSVSDTSEVSVSESEYEDVDYLVVYNNQSEYENKYVKICGQIDSIDRNTSNIVYITIKEGISGLTGEMYCNIKDSEAEETLSKYKEGDYVEIAGKVGNFVLKSLDLDDCYVVSSGDSVKKKIDNYKKQAKEKEASEEQEASVAAEKSKDDFIKECKTYTYKEISRNPANYEGKKAKFEGQVVQVMEDGDNVIMRVDVTKEENQFASGGYLYSDTVYVEYTRKSESESRILEDDIINMYGTLNGTKTYDTVLGSDTTIPYFVAEYIDIISD